jgi:YD repeat-containing protein
MWSPKPLDCILRWAGKQVGLPKWIRSRPTVVSALSASPGLPTERVQSQLKGWTTVPVSRDSCFAVSISHLDTHMRFDSFSITAPGSAVTTLQYHPGGLLSRVVDAEGGATTLDYNRVNVAKELYSLFTRAGLYPRYVEIVASGKGHIIARNLPDRVPAITRNGYHLVVRLGDVSLSELI